MNLCARTELVVSRVVEVDSIRILNLVLNLVPGKLVALIDPSKWKKVFTSTLQTLKVGANDRSAQELQSEL